jgi:hypothetical protein
MMNEDQPAPVTTPDILAALDLLPGTAGIPRLLDQVIWQVRNARAATQILLAENHPADNWLTAARSWDRSAILAAELRDRSERQARP